MRQWRHFVSLQGTHHFFTNPVFPILRSFFLPVSNRLSGEHARLPKLLTEIFQRVFPAQEVTSRSDLADDLESKFFLADFHPLQKLLLAMPITSFPMTSCSPAHAMDISMYANHGSSSGRLVPGPECDKRPRHRLGHPGTWRQLRWPAPMGAIPAPGPLLRELPEQGSSQALIRQKNAPYAFFIDSCNSRFMK